MGEIALGEGVERRLQADWYTLAPAREVAPPRRYTIGHLAATPPALASTLERHFGLTTGAAALGDSGWVPTWGGNRRNEPPMPLVNGNSEDLRNLPVDPQADRVP